MIVEIHTINEYPSPIILNTSQCRIHIFAFDVWIVETANINIGGDNPIAASHEQKYEYTYGAVCSCACQSFGVADWIGAVVVGSGNVGDYQCSGTIVGEV